MLQVGGVRVLSGPIFTPARRAEIIDLEVISIISKEKKSLTNFLLLYFLWPPMDLHHPNFSYVKPNSLLVNDLKSLKIVYLSFKKP